MSVYLYYLKKTDFSLDQIPLTDQQKEKLNQFKSKKRQKEWALSQFLRRFVFSQKLNLAMDELVFFEKKHHKPYLINQTDQAYDFNISHSGDYLVMAVSEPYTIGLDIETISDKRSILAIAKSFYTKNENDFLNKMNKDQKAYYFYLIWTLKEAFLKLDGTGIANGLKQCEFLIEEKKITPKKQAQNHFFLSFTFDDLTLGSLCLKDKINKKDISLYRINNNFSIVKENFNIVLAR